MRAVSAKRAVQNRVRAVAEAALGRDMDGNGVCARCGYYTAVHGHERVSRAHSSTSFMHPDCLLCDECNGWATDTKPAAWEGWTVTPKHDRDPGLGPDEARTLIGTIHHFRRAA